MADNKKILDLNGLGYFLRKIDAKKANIESPAFTGTPFVPTAPAGTKNTQIANTKFVNDNFILKTGDTMTGALKFNTSARPILDLHLSGTNLSNVYSLTTNGSLYIGDATSTGGARVYFARNIDKLNTALLTGVSIGYNPKDQVNWSSTSDYGIKFDVNIAKSNLNAIESAQFQAASFFVGLKGAYVGYSGDHRTALSSDKVYRILDSNCIKQDEYIKSLEQRIADLEAEIAILNPKEGLEGE